MKKRKMMAVLPLCPMDLERGMELAKLWADIEPARNDNVTVVVATRFDLPLESLDQSVLDLLKKKFDVMTVRIMKEGRGWPAGCNALEIGTYEWFVESN